MPIVTETPQPAPGEAPASAAAANRHHNEPPLEERISMEFREVLLSDNAQFTQRMESAIAAVDRANVTDEETLGKAGDLDTILRKCEQHIADTHKQVKQPYLDGGRACDAEKNRLIEPITKARFALKDRMNGFMAKREAERRAQQEREAAEARAAQAAAQRAEDEARAAEIAAQRAAAQARSEEEIAAAEKRAAELREKAEQVIAAAPLAAAPNKREVVRSDTGTTVSGRQVWQSEVEDYRKAFDAVASNEKVREAIDKAIAQLVKAGMRDIAGVRIWPTIAAVSR